jgi:hypothetical protein
MRIIVIKRFGGKITYPSRKTLIYTNKLVKDYLWHIFQIVMYKWIVEKLLE